MVAECCSERVCSGMGEWSGLVIDVLVTVRARREATAWGAPSVLFAVRGQVVPREPLQSGESIVAIRSTVVLGCL